MESWQQQQQRQQQQRSLSELLQEQQEPFIVMDHGCSSRRRMKRNRHAGGVGRSRATSASLWHGNAWCTGSLQRQSLSPVGGKSPSTSRLKLMEAAIKILEPSLQTPTGRSRSRSRSKSKCLCSPNVTTVRYLLELDHKANICQSQSHFRRSSASGLVLNSSCESPQICGRWVAKQLSVWQRASGAILSTLKPAAGSCSSRKKHGSLLRYSRLFTFRRPTGPTAEDENKEKHGLFRSIFRLITRNNNNNAAAAASLDESNQTELSKPDPENGSAGSKGVVRICDIVRWGSFGNDAEFPDSFMDKRQRPDYCYYYSERLEMNSQQHECSGSNSSCSRRLESDCSFTSTNSASSSSADSDSASGEVLSSSSSSAPCGSASSSSSFCCHCQRSSRDSNGHCCFKNQKGSFSPRAPLMASSPDREITIFHRLSTNDEFLSSHNETENSDATQDCCPNSDMFETANSEWLEDLEQSSPVSVLDSPFNEAACYNPTLDSIQRTKMRLLERISAYEKLAQMDVPQFAEPAESSGEEVDLEWPRTSSSSSSSACSGNCTDIHVDYDAPQTVEDQEQIQVQFHSKLQIPSSSSTSSSAMMEEAEEEEEYTQKWRCVAELVEMDMRGDTREWTEFRPETHEIGMHLELGIFRLLLQELLQDLSSSFTSTTTNTIQQQ